MKTVLLPVHPNWLELILSGKKTVEVRKTKPKEAVPFRVLLYCAKAKPYLVYGDRFNGQSFISEHATLRGYSRESAEKIWDIMNGKIVGEFVCNEISKFTVEFVDGDYYEDIRYCYTTTDDEEDKIIISTNEDNNPNKNWLCKESCLSFDNIKKYIGVNFHEKPFYGWHISDLKIYDKPKELSEFGLKRAPQSWCYVEELR